MRPVIHNSVTSRSPCVLIILEQKSTNNQQQDIVVMMIRQDRIATNGILVKLQPMVCFPCLLTHHQVFSSF